VQDSSDKRASEPLFSVQSGALLVAVLLLVVVIATHGIGKGELHYNTDETQHAFTGVFFMDFFSDRPFAHPMQYVYEYYAKYPALSLSYWPPLFHIVEGVVFLLLGPSVVTARLTVLLFVLLGCVFWYLLVKELAGMWTAALSCVLLFLLPSLLLFEKVVMLEAPTLALCIAASYFWIRYLREGSPRLAYAFSLLAGLSLDTKQNSIYLALFCLLTVMALRKWQIFRRAHLWGALGITVLVVAPVYVLMVISQWRTIILLFSGSFSRTDDASYWVLYYLRDIPAQVGWPLLFLSILGAVLSRLWTDRQTTLIFAMWVLSVYVSFTVIGHKESRYILYWLPPLAFFAAGLLTANCSRAFRYLRAAAVALILAFWIWSAWKLHTPYIAGYEPIARRLTSMPGPGVILFDGDLAGNFIFYMRTLDPARRFVILRKGLYVTLIDKRIGSRELIHTREGLDELIHRDGIRYVVVTQNSRIDFPVQRTLREYLATPKFRLMESDPVISNAPEYQGYRIELYEYVDALPRTEQYLHLSMMTIDHDIVVPFKDILPDGAWKPTGNPP